MTTKRLLLTALLLGTIISILTVTTVLASTNGILDSDQQCDQEPMQDCTGNANENGRTCSDACNGAMLMSQTRYRYQNRHCRNLGN